MKRKSSTGRAPRASGAGTMKWKPAKVTQVEDRRHPAPRQEPTRIGREVSSRTGRSAIMPIPQGARRYRGKLIG